MEPDWVRQVDLKNAGGKVLAAELYHSPKISADGERVYVSAAGNAGFRLQYKLDSRSLYEVTVEGANESGHATLRIGRDGKVSYHPAPDGRAVYSIFGVRSLELLIYADSPYRYRLDKVSILLCSECRDDEQLRLEIVRQIPGLDNMLVEQPLVAVRQLLDWAANRADYACGQSIAAQTNIAPLSASQIYYGVFEPNRGGVYCDGVAEFFDRILKLFAVDSFIWDFGDLANELTHVTVIVADHSGNKTRFFVFDPTFNLTFHDSITGELLDIEQVFELTRKGQWERIRAETRPLEQRDFLVPKEEPQSCREFRQEMPEWLVCGYPGYSIDVYLNNCASLFQAGGYQKGLPGFLELLMKRSFRVGSGIQPGTRESFTRLLERYGIPVGMP